MRRQGVAGVNVISFFGQLGGRALSPGSYTLTIGRAPSGSPALAKPRPFRIIAR
jgi:hypothetical protein